MKNNLFLFSFLLFCLYACNNDKEETSKEAGSDINVATDFIQSALKGDYEKAKSFMLQDSINLQRMDAIERLRLSPEEKKGLADASINIHQVSHPVKDSVTIVIYSNSFKNNWDTLKVVKQNGQWLVDFNYLFMHDTDSLSVPLLKTDSVRK